MPSWLPTGSASRLLSRLMPERPGQLAELGEQVLPFPDPQVVDELGPAQAAELGGGEFLLLLLQVVPQVQEAGEVRVLVAEAGVLLGGQLLLVRGTLARVLDGQRRGQDHHFADAAALAGLHDHPAQPGIHRQLGKLLPDGGQPPPLLRRQPWAGRHSRRRARGGA